MICVAILKRYKRICGNMCPWWNWIPLEPPTLSVRVRAPTDTPQRHTQKELIKLRCVCLFPCKTSFLRKLTLAMTGYDFLYLAFHCFRVRHNKKSLIKKRTSVHFFIICCRLFRDTYHGAKACPMLPVPTWSPFFRSCNRGLWKSLRGAEICPILRYMPDPAIQ